MAVEAVAEPLHAFQFSKFDLVFAKDFYYAPPEFLKLVVYFYFLTLIFCLNESISSVKTPHQMQCYFI